jgi:hypothetical protein
MTAILGRDDFALARRLDTEAAAEAARVERDKALSALLEARGEFAADAEAVCPSGARLAARDSDRLELAAGRILTFVDDLEVVLGRLDLARDLAMDGRVRRSRWDRAGLALGFGEALQDLLSSPASTVLLAAVRLEAAG